MTDTHEPTPEFLSHLEWQVRSALSRRDRFAIPARRTPVQVLRIAALILVSVFCGAAGVIASEEIQDTRRKEMLIRQAEIRRQLAVIQYDYTRSRQAETAQLQQEGLISFEELEASLQGLREAEVEVKFRELDLEEIRLSGVEPRNELWAPLVGERDFVTERLTLRLQRVQDHAEHVTRTIRRQLQRQDLTGAQERRELEASLQQNEAMLEVENIARQRDLRRRFLAGEITAEEIERQVRLHEVESGMRIQQQNMVAYREHLAEMQRLHDAGLIRDLPLRQAETQLREKEMELQLLQLQLEYLRGGEGQ